MLFSNRMNFEANASEVPPAIVAEAHDASRSVCDPDTAKALFDELVPILENCRPNSTFALSCGLLMEKQRNVEGMLEFWADISSLFPEDLTALRMMMRWYRRERRNADGIEKAQEIFSDCHTDAAQAERTIVALSELKAFKEIDEMMTAIAAIGAPSRTLKMRYIKVLSQQSRFLDALAVVETVPDQHKMGPSSQELISTVRRRAASAAANASIMAGDPFSAILETLPEKHAAPTSTLGNIAFFTGQLGTGGAERQLTRIACALHEKYEQAALLGDVILTKPPSVCVRHAAQESGGDFFLPVLKKSRVQTNILTEMNDVSIADLEGLTAAQASLLDLLPDDICSQTCKLIPYFQKRQTSVAYLWQDGGVLSAAIAALIAGVPRIVTSFRGLPPNLRPNLSKPAFEPLYRALSKRSEVVFTANSRSSARAYEDWLGLETGTVKTLPNAMPDIVADGDEEDHAFWDDVIGQSPSANQTVLGVFRFDDNKRPLLWIEMAAEFAAKHPETRFVIVGSGYLLSKARTLIQDLGMSDRIFLAGVRRNVGFYLHRCDLVMHLAQMEGLPNVLIEAHLAGKPVVATPAGGTEEVVQHGTTGTILKSAEEPDPDEIQAVLRDMLSDPRRLQAMGNAAQQRAKPIYLIDQVLERTITLFAIGELPE